MNVQEIQYHADELQMRSTLYVPSDEDGPRPGVLVFPEAFGLGENARTRAERLAGLGYVALACDYYGEAKQYDAFEEALAGVKAMQDAPERARARALGGLQALADCPGVDRSRIAAIGYCFGGTLALELVRSGADIAGAIGFHSGLGALAPAVEGAKAPVLVCIGADDPGIDAAQRLAFETEMRDAGIDWQMKLYGGVVHSFTNPHADQLGMPEFARYSTKADENSWEEMLTFFRTIF